MADGELRSYPPEAWALLEALLRDYKAGRLTNRPPGGPSKRGDLGGQDSFAVAADDIPPGESGDVLPADGTFQTESRPKTAFNPSLMTIPKDARLLVGRVKRRPGLTIKTAYLCEDF